MLRFVLRFFNFFAEFFRIFEIIFSSDVSAAGPKSFLQLLRILRSGLVGLGLDSI